MTPQTFRLPTVVREYEPSEENHEALMGVKECPINLDRVRHYLDEGSKSLQEGAIHVAMVNFTRGLRLASPSLPDLMAELNRLAVFDEDEDVCSSDHSMHFASVISPLWATATGGNGKGIPDEREFATILEAADDFEPDITELKPTDSPMTILRSLRVPLLLGRADAIRQLAWNSRCHDLKNAIQDCIEAICWSPRNPKAYELLMRTISLQQDRASTSRIASVVGRLPRFADIFGVTAAAENITTARGLLERVGEELEVELEGVDECVADIPISSPTSEYVENVRRTILRWTNPEVIDRTFSTHLELAGFDFTDQDATSSSSAAEEGEDVETEAVADQDEHPMEEVSSINQEIVVDEEIIEVEDNDDIEEVGVEEAEEAEDGEVEGEAVGGLQQDDSDPLDVPSGTMAEETVPSTNIQMIEVFSSSSSSSPSPSALPAEVPGPSDSSGGATFEGVVVDEEEDSSGSHDRAQRAAIEQIANVQINRFTWDMGDVGSWFLPDAADTSSYPAAAVYLDETEVRPPAPHVSIYLPSHSRLRNRNEDSARSPVRRIIDPTEGHSDSDEQSAGE